MIAEPLSDGKHVQPAWKRIAINEVAIGKLVLTLPARFFGPMDSMQNIYSSGYGCSKILPRHQLKEPAWRIQSFFSRFQIHSP